MSDWQRDVQTAYDRVAAEYATRIYGELAGKPFDRAILDRFAALAAPLGPICDLGCGPGQVARYLHDHAQQPRLDVFGIDLSPEMVAQARRLNPDLRFEQGTMLALDLADAQLGGIAAFYSIVNVPRDDQPGAFAECWRVLKPGGSLLVAFHLGDEDVHLDEWWGTAVSVDFYFFAPAEIEARLAAAGFMIEERHVREPYPDVEHPSRRAYLLARKPPDTSTHAPPLRAGDDVGGADSRAAQRAGG
jgi:ubiquinone/menaquinone biosynthesis C-methylase UbiE